jgi:DNA repair protein RadA/Sms
MEGTRPILVEVQALVAPTSFGTPLRRTSGVDSGRLALLIAVLGRRAGLSLTGHDVYVNVVGGLSIDEPALDLPIALALASSLRDRSLEGGMVAVGEIGLLGELREVGGLDRRLREAARLGFSRAIAPASTGAGSDRDRRQPTGDSGLHVIRAATLRDAVRAALEDGGKSDRSSR